MDTLISTAETGFASTTGFSLSSLVGWTADNLIKLWIGTGIAILYELRYWIAALIVIGIVVYFAFRAFRFHRA